MVRRELDRPAFEALLTEADGAGLGTTLFDTHAGLAVRRYCAPVLELPAHATPDAYLERRAELGVDEVNRRFLRAAGLERLCVDTGFEPEPLLSVDELADVAGAPGHEVVRLERVAEQVAADGGRASDFAAAIRGALIERSSRAVGFKSIAAYRGGLELPGERPDERAVVEAAKRLLAVAESGGSPRVADPVLHAFLVWCAVETGLPVQFHVGYGDNDLDLRRADPLLLTGLLRALPADVPVMLLHNYPYQRQAGYLAQVFGNVFVDVGLAGHNVGPRAAHLVAEILELAPFGKFCFSSDAFGLPELYYLGALAFRAGVSAFCRSGGADGWLTREDAARIARLVGAENARRAYGLAAR